MLISSELLAPVLYQPENLNTHLYSVKRYRTPVQHMLRDLPLPKLERVSRLIIGLPDFLTASNHQPGRFRYQSDQQVFQVVPHQERHGLS